MRSPRLRRRDHLPTAGDLWAGAIGLATLEALRRRGETVRLVNRSGTAPVPDDVDILGGDASDPAFTAAAAHGAQDGDGPWNRMLMPRALALG